MLSTHLIYFLTFPSRSYVLYLHPICLSFSRLCSSRGLSQCLVVLLFTLADLYLYYPRVCVCACAPIGTQTYTHQEENQQLFPSNATEKEREHEKKVNERLYMIIEEKIL